MKVTKSAIHRLEIESSCTCKAAGEFEDAACKKQKGEVTFTPCETHKGVAGVDFVEQILKEALLKEARDLKLPETIHPRSLDRQPVSEAETKVAAEAAAVPARTLRTAGSTGEIRAPAAAPARSAPGSHRPQGGGGGVSPFRRTQAGGNLSPRAAAAVAGSKVAASSRGGANPGGISFEDDIDMDAVPEDSRVTRILEESDLLGDGTTGDDEDMF